MNSHITSIPLLNSYKNSSLPASPSSSRLTPNIRSPKYLIASPTCGTPFRRQSDRGASSPILNSSVNLSLYTNAQSPGLASRIVEYDRAQNGRSPTHNRKFGSPGIFPIVHLYKNNLPVASPKPKRVTVKIAPPDDLSMYNNIDHSIVMSENARITKFYEHSANESGTRSVLDALKEISRKRIHSAAEFESVSPEGNTRKRNKRVLESTTNQQAIPINNLSPPYNATNNNKRLREESPPNINCLSTPNLNNTPEIPNNGTEKSTPKRYCSIDPITASFTSANLMFQELRKNPTKTVEEHKDDLPFSPLRKTKQVDAQTNTTEILASKTSYTQEIIETETQQHKSSAIEPIKNQVPTPNSQSNNATKPQEIETVVAPLFDPKPLEAIRRNKLAALLGAISGEGPIIMMEKPAKVLVNQLDVEAPVLSTLPLPSILPAPSDVPKVPKHVTFDLTPNNQNPLAALTQTTTALVMPISSTMIAPFRDTTALITTSSNCFVVPTSVVPSLNAVNAPAIQISNSSPPKVVGGFKFDLSTTPASSSSTKDNVAAPIIHSTQSPGGFSFAKTSLTSVAPILSSTNTIVDLSSSGEVAKLNFQFGAPTVPESTPQQPALSFGLNNAPTSTSTAPSFSFSGSQQAVPITTADNSTFSFGGNSTTSTTSSIATTTSIAKPAFSFNSKPAQVATSSKPASSGTTTLPVFGGTALTSNMFAKPSSFQHPSNNAVGFPLTTSASTKFGLGTANVNNSPFGVPASTTAITTASAPFSFGGSTNNIPSTTFGGTTINATIPSFGTASNSNSNVAPTTASNIFGAASSTPVVSTANSFLGFGTINKEPTSTNNQQQSLVKFGEISATTAAAAAAATTTALFSFGGTTSTADNQNPKPLGEKLFFNGNTSGSTAFNSNLKPPGSIGTGNFGGASKMSFGGFGGTNNQVAPNQTISNNSTFSFGGTTNTNAFDAASSFIKPTNFGEVSPFGAQQSTSFNSSTNSNNVVVSPNFGTPPQQTKLFTFGGATATPKAAEAPSNQLVSADKPSGIFAFGTPAKPQGTTGGFNFSTGNNPTFGSAIAAPAPVMFGTPQGTPAFNVGGGFSSPGLVGNPGMFSIGSGSSSGPNRPRTQLKTKRRT